MWPFKKNAENRPGVLPFKGGAEFFEYQCKFGETEIVEKRGVVGLVLDARLVAGTSEPTKWNDDGSQTVTIKVASEDGGFITIAQTPPKGGQAALQPGDVVIWVPLKYIDTSAMADLDPRMGWVGFVVAKVAPEIDLNSDGFKILEQYA